jgi:hypothetical protein
MFMRILVFALPLVMSSVAFTASGFADSSTSGPSTAKVADLEPLFAMMDNTGDGTKVEINLAFAVMPSSLDGMFLGGRMVVQRLWPSGHGIYGTVMPTEAGLGSVDIGGLFHTAMSSNSSIGAKLGVAIALDGDDAGIPWLRNAMMQPADVILGLDTTALRLGVSPTFRSEAGFLRIDLGIDVAMRRGAFIIGHGNLGAGIGNEGLSATAELQSVFASDGGSETTWFGALGVSVRLRRAAASPFVMVAKPFGIVGFGGLAEGLFTVTVGFALGV